MKTNVLGSWAQSEPPPPTLITKGYFVKEINLLDGQIKFVGQQRANPTYQAFVTLQPDWLPFNSLGADVVNKRKYKTDKVSELPHIILLNML